MDQPAWIIDELDYAGPEHLDPGFVAGYDRKQGHPDPAAEIAVLRKHGLDSSATLVDLGTGTGRVALAAVPHARRVVAADVSPAMLAHVREQAAEAGAGSLEVVRAGFLSYEHTGAPADFVHTRNALHQLPDFFKAIALDRIARILRPGGILRLHDLVYDFRPSETEEVFERWMGGAATDPARGYTREDFEEHVRTEYSTFRWLLEPMLRAAGFEITEVAYDRSVYAAYTCVRR